MSLFLFPAMLIALVAVPGICRTEQFDINTMVDSVINEGILVVDGDHAANVVKVVDGAEIIFRLLEDTNITNVRGGSFFVEDFELGSPAIIANDQSTLSIYWGHFRGTSEQ